MSSSVFFRFKSQKEPSRVTFDGTGISVFELKREIINLNRLGDGTDFELLITSEDTDEEYKDDTSIIPRSTTVIAKRLPAAKAGRGGAARYVSGKMPQNPKNNQRTEASMPKNATLTKNTDLPSGLPDISNAQNEEQNIAAMFKIGADQWAQQQQEMASATPIHRNSSTKTKTVNVPDRPPPPGYICYRCGEKGHWIQACPTNDDPTFDGRPRVKRTTGIPRSFLKTIEKPASLANEGMMDECKHPSGVMVNAEGEWVIAEPDQASWENFHAKAKVSAAAQEAATLDSKDLQEKGLECSLDKRLFVEPTKTPCCHTTYCHDCINNALLENDLRCPGCSTENILIDDLKPDEEMAAKIRTYEEEKATCELKERTSKDLKEKPSLSVTHVKPSFPAPNTISEVSTTITDPAIADTPKKRAAEMDLKNDRNGRAPSTPNSHLKLVNVTKPQSLLQQPDPVLNRSFPSQSSFTTSNYMLPMNFTALPNHNEYMGFPLRFVPPMNSGMLNTMVMSEGSILGRGGVPWGNSWGAAGSHQSASMVERSFQNEMMFNADYGQQNPHNSMKNGPTHMSSNNQAMASFSNQQQTAFGAPTFNEEDSAYFRKPVNPHRHQARRNVTRPTDYREI